MNKYILLFSITLILIFKSEAQFPGWSWAISAGGPEADGVNKTITDASGNVFIVGAFRNYLTFESTTLVSNGDYDLYVAKYNSKGNLLWAKSAGGDFRDFVNDITVDASGNIYITGSFRSSFINFGSATLTNQIPNISSNIFIVKYSSSGDVIWAKSAGISEGINEGSGITTDQMGNVFVTGSFGSPSISFDSITLTNIGLQDIFIVQFSSTGTVIWALSEGGSKNDGTNRIIIDAFGNLLVIGSFDSPSISFGSTVLINSGFYSDIFIAKYTSSGAILWATSAGGNNADEVFDVTTDISGNIYTTGRFYSPTISFDTIIFVNAGQWDTFIAKYDSSGNLLWAKSFGTPSIENGWGICTDSSGDIYLIGTFDSHSMNFDSITLTNASYNFFDVFVSKFSPSGEVKWAINVGNTGSDSGRDITTDNFNNIYVTGHFAGESITFGSTVLMNTIPHQYNSDVFLAKIDSPNKITEGNIVVYPNPILNYLTIESDNVIGRIHLYDFLGRTVMDIKVNEKNSILDMSQLSIGLYYLKSEHQEKGIKIIKY